MDGSFFFVMFLVLVATGVAGALVMQGKGRSPIGGFALGFLLGLIGVLICAVVPKTTEKRIEEQIEFDATMRRIQGLHTPPEPPVEVPHTTRGQ